MCILRTIAGPVDRIIAKPHMAMKRGPCPVAYARDQPMLDRIDVDVVDMAHEIAFIAYGMLPIAALPDSAFAPCGAAR